jgi:hypothetical protein
MITPKYRFIAIVGFLQIAAITFHVLMTYALIRAWESQGKPFAHSNVMVNRYLWIPQLIISIAWIYYAVHCERNEIRNNAQVAYVAGIAYFALVVMITLLLLFGFFRPVYGGVNIL